MFFDKVLVENSELRRVWRAGFGRIEETEGKNTFPNICINIEECVGSEDPNPRRRLSLRTSSVLVEGAARIYRQELSRLIEDLSEVDREMATRNIRLSTHSEEDTPTDSSNSSAPYNTPENMRRQTPRISNVSIPRPDDETIPSLKTSDLRQSLSSDRNSTDSQQSSRCDGENDQSAKRRKMTDQANISTEYPSSPDLTTDRSSEDLTSEEETIQAYDQDILLSQKPTKNASAECDPDDHAKRKTDQHESEGILEENSPVYPDSPTFTDDFVASSPKDKNTGIPEINEARVKSLAGKNAEEIIHEADTGTKCDKNVTTRKKATDEENSSVRRSDVVKDSGNATNARDEISPILPFARKALRKSKNINRSVVKKDQATQTDDVSFHPSASERGRKNENLPFGYLLIHDTYSSRYPSKIMISSMNPLFRNL